MLQSLPSTSGAKPSLLIQSMRSASRRAWLMIAAWLRNEPGVTSAEYLAASTTPRSSAPSLVKPRWRPASRSASGALAQPGTLERAGGRKPRLEGADSKPILMGHNYQMPAALASSPGVSMLMRCCARIGQWSLFWSMPEAFSCRADPNVNTARHRRSSRGRSYSGSDAALGPLPAAFQTVSQTHSLEAARRQ